MPEYLSPGVYIEEIDAGPRPIQGVSTSTTGMVGVTVRGPLDGKPKLVTSFLQFQRDFGGFLPEPPLTLRTSWEGNLLEGGRWWLFAHAVKGFFDNGGQRLFVKRVAAGGATRATGSFVGGLISEVARDASKDATEIRLQHLVGIDVGTTVKILYQDPANVGEQSNVDVVAYDATQRTITVDPNDKLTRELKAGRDLVEITAPNTTATLRVAASAEGSWGKAIRVQVRPVVTTLSLLADPNEGASFSTRVLTPPNAAPNSGAPQDSATIDVATVSGLSLGTPASGTTPAVPAVPATPFFVQIGRGQFEVTAMAPVVQGQTDRARLTLNPTTHPAWREGFQVRRVRRVNTAAAATLRVSGAARLYPGAIVELDTGQDKQTLRVQSVAGDALTFESNANAGYFENHKLHLVEAQVVASHTDEAGNVVDEEFTDLRLTQDVQTGLASINGRSRLVTVEQPGDLANATNLRFPVLAQSTSGGQLPLDQDGEDAFGSLSPDDFVGERADRGIQSLELIDDVAICAVPGIWSGFVQSNLIQHCEQLKDRFAVLDPPDPQDIEQIQEFRNRYDTRYAALYYPWLVARDPSTDRDVNLPPSGHMAGIYARVDVERGVHKAPANVVVRGVRVIDGFARPVTKREQDQLNPNGINALRFFPEFGHRVWGARTLSSDTTWKYINVRRLFIFVEESIEEGTQWVVFEPNDEPLWALVRQTITNFLTTVWRTGALAGTTTDEAFFVACDRTTMTQDDIDNGRLICVIGIAPVFPAEFVIFRIQQKTRELQPA